MLTTTSVCRIAQEIAEKRFPPKEGEVYQDMLGSFIRHGLTKEEAESESVTQMYERTLGSLLVSFHRQSAFLMNNVVLPAPKPLQQPSA
jgi:hypothetical protein